MTTLDKVLAAALGLALLAVLVSGSGAPAKAIEALLGTLAGWIKAVLGPGGEKPRAATESAVPRQSPLALEQASPFGQPSPADANETGPIGSGNQAFSPYRLDWSFAEQLTRSMWPPRVTTTGDPSTGSGQAPTTSEA